MAFVSSVILGKGLPLILSSVLKGYFVEAVIETSGIVELCSSEGRGERLTGALTVESTERKLEPLFLQSVFVHTRDI